MLPLLQKVALRAWLHASERLLCLHDQSSHVFRKSFQGSELQLLIRQIVDKRLGWGLPTIITKFGSAKAYVSVAWEANSWIFERRDVPHAFRSAYWRTNTGRELQFRTWTA